MQLLNASLHFTSNKFTTPTHLEEILEQPIFLNLHAKLNNPYFYNMPPKNIIDKFIIISDLCRFLQPGLNP